MKLTQARLKELLHYDPETGAFTWVNPTSNRVKTERIAGTLDSNGYRRIAIDHKRYGVSRLAFLYVEGYFPEHEVDHINRIRHDDRWCNLRHVSHSCNVRNSGTRRDNGSGITGVYLDKSRQKWAARIWTPDKKFFLGRFNSKLDAAKARWQAEVKHGFPGCNSTSSAYQYLQSKGGISWP